MPGPPPHDSQDAPAESEAFAHLRAFLGEGGAACPSCQYSLAGLNAATCPECGWRIALRLDDGADSKQIVQVARWVAVLGLLITVPTLLQYAYFLVSFGAFGPADLWLLYMCVYLVLCWYSGSTLFALRKRQRTRAVRALVKTARRRARVITWACGICILVPWIIQTVSLWLI